MPSEREPRQFSRPCVQRPNINMLSHLSVVALLAFAGFALAEEKTSPCPNNFKYLETSKAGEWTGELNIKDDHTLHGVWLRAIFDGPVTGVKSENFGTAKADERKPNEVLLKNYDILYKKNTVLPLPITVTYAGSVAPKLTGFRINGRTVCPVDAE